MISNKNYKVETIVEEGKPSVCNHPNHSTFFIKKGKIFLCNIESFPFYSLNSILWGISSLQGSFCEVACPDPYCKAIFRVSLLPEGEL